MVQIRDSLPLLGGNSSSMDSATLAASLVAKQLHPDFKAQLANHKLVSALDHTNSTINPSDLNVSDIDIEAWIAKVAARIGKDDLPILRKACQFVQIQVNKPHVTRSGAYITGIGMADILAYLFQDENALAAAMLYRTARRELVSIDTIKKNFGEDIAHLVMDTLAMGKLSESIESNKRLEDYFESNQRDQLSNIYSMLISTTNDVRAVLIKLAERTFAMRELSFSPPDRQKRVAREVMTIYAPLAHRLSIAQLKWELEDLAFRYLAPEEYKKIASLLAEKRSEREAYIESVKAKLSAELERAGIQGEVSGRVKHIYSIWRKMKSKNLSFDQLYDIRALRVMVNTNAECYYTLGIVHGLWRHIPEQFDDYITNPKPNGYKSLHTAVIAENRTLEVQIRTFDMHFEAELGKASHVNYKEGLKAKKDDYLTQKISSLRQLLGQDIPDGEDEIDLDVDNAERIYVFSRDGDITELPKGSTVLDFAYYVHTEVGNRAQGARVNGRYVPLTHQPKTGDQIEIITKSSREPNRDWLMPSLGYIHTSRAKSKLRQWFNKQDRDKNIETGKGLLLKEFDRLSIAANQVNLSDYFQTLNVKSEDDLYVALVIGDISVTQISNLVAQKLHIAEPAPDVPSIDIKTPARTNKFKIDLDGFDNVEMHLAKCCNPVHGEPIAGFVTLSNGVSIHNQGCPEYLRLIEKEPDRGIHAHWQDSFGRYQPVVIHVEAQNTSGLLRDLVHVIDREKVNISRAETVSNDGAMSHMKFYVEVAGISHLSRLLNKIEQQPGVLHARRATA
ncbi:bifunctional (p)ppGpp synthetase/guanosine-3',5'-bis(diphosphate) 3'-pyrophosphohydrolase [Moraxella sp. FZLJ2107]|uniref:RelA/SpoT family protein n=1 Tax=unclassified Moraxella TaxID=2685852 RepID=UPI0020C8F420|nr:MULTISPECIES: bifunctional (p)ppGpp synthetase/guanosine-3',5'-bis(diphosphate) 3'-pyrophosphohydrolase [unclassified Moraxella]UTO04213.1 bifunctional (p)ppGpp synthetase/guanosine-3',5'-bis(diphosphate) 3'-pyrophosphohydrolase [Moraxella sp. FZLJ2107]UTO23046.1 bifunctional (p)ppGpp synthetase/guanosine-3',5'-bis(diphosphate) 3'-pyrophosphohydrolase [Moraxella sp. FZLJ2109]